MAPAHDFASLYGAAMFTTTENIKMKIYGSDFNLSMPDIQTGMSRMGHLCTVGGVTGYCWSGAGMCTVKLSI